MAVHADSPPAMLGPVVADRVRETVRAAPLTPAYRAALVAALALPGNILSERPNTRWARLVATCCSAAAGRWDDAVAAAAAVELLMVALDLLDDEEDGDESALRCALGAARVLNVSTGLLLLAQQSLFAIDGATTAAALLLDAALRACAGQHSDLAPRGEHDLSLHTALATAVQKSAPLVAVACRLGAWCARADERTQDLYARFGEYVGAVAQLANDLAAIHPDTTGKTDLALERSTVPLTYAALLAPATDARGSEGDERAALWTNGATHLTWIVAETYRRRAFDLLPQLSADPTARAALAALVPVL